MRKFTLLTLLIISSMVFAEGIPWKPHTDVGLLGRSGSADPVELFFDVGDGASNPKILVDKTAKTFDLSKPTRVQGDLTIGDGTPSDRNLIIDEGAGGNNPRLTWDTTTNKWKQFDGTSERVIGSGTGGGGGQNFFADKNPDAEGGTNNWTVTGTGTFSTFTATPINGLTSFRWDSDLQNDVLRTDQVAIPEKFKGQACEVNFTYTGGTDDLVKPQVVDSSNVKLPGATYRNQVDNSDFLKAQTAIVQRTIFFICPTSGTIALEFNQTAAGDPAIMDFDDVHIGELIGLNQSVQGDVVSAKVSSGDVVSDENINWINGDCTNATVGQATCIFVSGIFTVAPNCTCTAEDASARICHIETAPTSSSILIEITDTSGSQQNTAFTLSCQKQGVDAQQTIQVFTSIPKVAENINNFSAKVTDADVVSDENADWIDGDCTDANTGRATCVFVAGTFSEAPNCTCMTDDVGGRTCHIEGAGAVTASQILVETTDMGGTSINTGFHLKCAKTGADFKLPTVQPIVVGQVTNSKAENGGTDNIRVESCRIDNNGTATINDESGLCGWISSVNRTAAGEVDNTFVAGIFSIKPICHINTLAPTAVQDDRHCEPVAANATNTFLEVACGVASTGISTDFDYIITCIGVR